MILHILNRSPSVSRTYQDALAAMRPTDSLMLIEDGVQGALPQLVRYFEPMQGQIFALREDLASRGLEGRCADHVVVVDVDGFVELTEEAEKTVSWF